MFSRSLSQDMYEQLLALSRDRLLLLLLAFTGVMIFSGMGLRSPWPADEPRFAEVAREMVDSGQWLIPMRGGEFYPDKPPVFMWSIAFFYWLTGNLKLAFLLPNALCGMITVIAVYDLAIRLWNRHIAAVAVLLLLLAPQFLMQAKSAQIDGMVACWITLACYGLLRHFFCGPAWGWYFTAWGFMGLGIITKGVGFLPALMMIPLLILHWRDRTLFAERMHYRAVFGPLVMLAVAGLWLIPMVLYVDAINTTEALAYRDNILFRQTGERYANSWGHLKPWHYFLTTVIPVLWFPLPLLLLACLRPLRDGLKHQPVIVVLLVWVLLVVGFFSFSPGKRGVYILPALPIFAIAVAAITAGKAQARWLGLFLTGLQGALSLALIVLGVLAWQDHPPLVDKIADYSRNPTDLHTAGSFMLTLGLTWLFLLAGLWRRAAIMRFFTALMVTWLLYSTWGYTLMEPLRTPRNILSAAETRLPSDATIGIIDFSEQLILFSKLDVVHFSYFTSIQEQERNAWQWMNEAGHRYVLAAKDLEFRCFNPATAIDLGVAHRERWLLMGPEQQARACDPPQTSQRYLTPNPGRWLE